MTSYFLAGYPFSHNHGSGQSTQYERKLILEGSIFHFHDYWRKGKYLFENTMIFLGGYPFVRFLGCIHSFSGLLDWCKNSRNQRFLQFEELNHLSAEVKLRGSFFQKYPPGN